MLSALERQFPQASLSQAAGDVQRLARKPFRVVRGQKHRRRRDIVGMTDSPEWRRRFVMIAEVAFVEPGRANTLGLDQTWVNRVDAYLPRTKLLSEATGNRVHSAFGRAVDRRRWRR